MKRQLLFFVALTLLLPSAIAFSCDSLSGGDFVVCKNISSSSLSSQDKDLLISDLFNKNRTSPNFDFAYSWNSNLAIPNSPDGQTYSQGTINNAWISIVFVNPAILSNKTLFVSNSGKIRTEYNYGYTLPSGTESGDCDTRYSLSNKQEILKVYLNNQLIGNSKISSFSVYNQENLTFKSEVNLIVTYKVKHYQYNYDEDYPSCEYDSTEYRTDTLTISDTLNAKLYQNSPSSTFNITNQYNNITKGVLTANNYSSLTLSFNNSYYKTSKYVYSLNYSLPYYVLTIRADPSKNSQSNNLNVNKVNDSFYFTVLNANNCQIELDDFFSSNTKTCNMAFNPANFSIIANKTYYSENETIGISIYPSNILVNLTYANQTKLIKNYTEFKAVAYQNKITGIVNKTEESIFINVIKANDIKTLYDFSAISLLSYLFYRFGKFCLIKVGL